MSFGAIVVVVGVVIVVVMEVVSEEESGGRDRGMVFWAETEEALDIREEEELEAAEDMSNEVSASVSCDYDLLTQPDKVVSVSSSLATDTALQDPFPVSSL